MVGRALLDWLVAALAAQVLLAERINHEGRILGGQPFVTAPTLVNTPEADAILASLQICATDSPWNEDISRWTVYAAPGPVGFKSGGLTDEVEFRSAGVYTLVLGADDGVHAVAYDAVVITVQPALRLTIAPAGTEALLAWSGGSSPFAVEVSDRLVLESWQTWLHTDETTARVPLGETAQFFPVRSL